jgi:hypothetical protein
MEEQNCLCHMLEKYLRRALTMCDTPNESLLDQMDYFYVDVNALRMDDDWLVSSSDLSEM